MDTTNEVACRVGASPQPAPTTHARARTAPLTLTDVADLLRREGILASASTPAGPEQPQTPVSGAACDSRHVAPGNVFFCKGAAFRPAFLASALERGAVAYLCEPDRAAELAGLAPQAPALVTSDMRAAMALVSAAAFGRPDLALPQAGITGTKGKSTTAYMLRAIIEAAGRSCGVIGSIETIDGVEEFESLNTTPEAPDLWRHLANARTAGLDDMVMEVSSQALKYERTRGVHLDVAAFLNIGRDHISPLEHPTFEDYFSSKLRIFSQCDVAVVNLGTKHLERVLDAAGHENLEGRVPRLVTVSAAGPEPVECGSCDMAFPDVWATDVRPRGFGISFTVHGEGWELPVHLGIPGLFNVENALVAVAMARELLAAAGLGEKELDAAIERGLARVRVPGRMEPVASGRDDLIGIVDYAHNATSMEALLSSLRKTYPRCEWELDLVFGSTGSKGLDRRTDMGHIAGAYADHVVITEDDPGEEDPRAICADIARCIEERGDVPHVVVLNREEAIRRAVFDARPPAVVAAIGKGPDKYMERDGRVDPYEGDEVVLERAFEERRWRE